METIFMNTENSKTNESHKYVPNLSQILNLKISNKYVAPQNLWRNTWKNIRREYKNNNFKIITPTCNHEFGLPDGSYSVSDTQDCIEYIIKKHETLTAIAPIHVYNNRIYNRLVFKIKDGYKLELQTPETIKLFGSIQKLIDKTRNGEKILSLKVAEVV